MAHLSDQPAATASPFATPPTIIETHMSAIQHAMVHGVGTAFGLAIGGYLLYLLIGKRVV